MPYGGDAGGSNAAVGPYAAQREVEAGDGARKLKGQGYFLCGDSAI